MAILIYLTNTSNLKFMKSKYLLILANIFAFTLCIGQTINITGYKINGMETDKLIIGFNPNSSISIDTDLGEYDISDKPISEKGLVVLQKKQSDFECLYNMNASPPEPIYFDESFESNINIRKGSNYFDLFFEIRNYNKEFDDIEIRESQSNDILNNIIEKIWLIDSCDIVNASDINFDSIPYLLNSLTIIEPDFKTLIIKFRASFINSSTDTHVEKRPEIFPNPSQSYIKINYLKSIMKVEIYNLSGQLELETKSTDLIDLSELSEGVKIIKIYDTNGTAYIDRLIKI